MRRLSYYALGVLLGIDILINALLGGQHYQTVSCRIGDSIMADGWAARVPWPAWFRSHCLESVYPTIV